MRADYHSWQPWVRWLPYQILVWLSLRKMGKGHIWFQSERLGVQLGLQPFKPVTFPRRKP